MLFGIMGAFAFAIEYGKEASVKIEAKVLRPVKIAEVKNIDFGVIPAGKSAKTNGAQNGYIVIETPGRLKVTWKDKMRGEYVDINRELPVSMRKKDRDYEMVATVNSNFGDGSRSISSNDSNVLIERKGGKIVFSATIATVPKMAQGEYRGSFLVRVEYKDEI